MKSVNYSKPGSKISNIPYNLIFTTKFNDSSILITIISCDYLNLSLANEYAGDVTIPTVPVHIVAPVVFINKTDNTSQLLL
jgi:hypothetical protein